MKPISMLAILMALKGGCGKSHDYEVLAAAAQALGLRIAHLDADGFNSSTTTVYPDAKFTDLLRPEGIGAALSALDDIHKGKIDLAAWDIAAGQQGRVIAAAPRLTKAAAAAGVPMVWIHPVTTSHHVQREALDAVEIAKKFNMALVYARNLGQGRTPYDFRFWDESRERKKALEYAVEAEIPDAGAFFGDNARSFGLSLYDTAYGNFERVDPADRASVEALFDRDFRAFAARYLEEATENLFTAVAVALSRVATGAR